jgi:hypothetical protein
MLETQDFNPFDTSNYVASGTEVATPEPETQNVEDNQETNVQVEDSTPTNVVDSSVQTELEQSTEVQESNADEFVPFEFEWPNEVAKDIYDKLVSGDIGELADIIYEQKVLSSLDSMSEEDVIKLKMAYEYPELTAEEIEDEFNSKYKVDDKIDESLYTDEEIEAKRREIEKSKKASVRMMKKDMREAKDFLSEMKQEISFPDILSQVSKMQSQPRVEELLNQYMAQEDERQNQDYQVARQDYLNSINDGLKNFEGFSVNYKDEDVQFDGKYSLTPEDKAVLTDTLKDFDLDLFYGNRYYKDGKYDAKQIAEDVYFLQNRDKIVNSMVTQAVSKAKSDLIKSMKNIDISDGPRLSATASSSDDYDKMVAKMFSL